MINEGGSERSDESMVKVKKAAKRISSRIWQH